MFDYSKDELVGKEVEILVPEQFRAVHRKDRATYYADPSIRRMGVGRELSARGKDGVDFPVEISLSPIKIRGKTLVWSAIRDICDRERFLAQLHEAMQRQQVVLAGLISICSWCRRVRDDGTWLSLERYLASHSEAKFTHCICKDCLAALTNLAAVKKEPGSQ
jgi:PAS domain S-box-containing protein